MLRTRLSGSQQPDCSQPPVTLLPEGDTPFRYPQAPGTRGTKITREDKTPTYVKLNVDTEASQHTLLPGRGAEPAHAEGWPQWIGQPLRKPRSQRPAKD